MVMHYLETARFAPDAKEGRWRETFWEAFAEVRVPFMQDRGMELVGAWQTPIGAGNGNEFSFLYSVANQSAWARYVEDTSGLSVDTRLRAWRSVAADYIERCFTRLLLPSPGHDVTVLGRHEPAEPRPAAGPARTWLYELELTDFVPDGRGGRWREDYWPEFRERLVSILERLGVELVGAWETAPGSGHADEFAFLYRTTDFSSWQRFIEAIAGSPRDPVLRQRRSEMWVWREQWYSKLMVPAVGHQLSLLHRELE